MASPTELRTFAEMARKDAEDYRQRAENVPSWRDYYLKCSNDREEDYRFWTVKADRDEAWNGTEDYVQEAAE